MFLEIKVRVSETDALGHINNKSYFDYMEEGRIDFLKKINMPEDKNHVFILAKTCCEYLRQGYFGQILQVKTTVGKVGTKSLTLISEIFNKETNELIAKGESIVVYFDMNEQQSLHLPFAYKEKLKKYDKYEDRSD